VDRSILIGAPLGWDEPKLKRKKEQRQTHKYVGRKKEMMARW
jgi:hypothetical protein